MANAFSHFMQLGYVTADLPAARALMAARYGVGDFIEMPAEFACNYRGRSGEVALTIALANVRGVQIELILPRGGMDAIYAEAIAAAPDQPVVLHHVGVHVAGDRAAWRAHLADLAARGRDPIWGGDVGPEQDFCYCDDRATLGHYTEYLWWTDKGMMAQPGLIPFNP